MTFNRRRGIVPMSIRRFAVSMVITVLGVLVFGSAPALAAIETPETGYASAITAHTATLEGGVLNPNKPGETKEYEYEYMYKASASECQGASTAPVPEGHGVGLEKEAVPPVKLTGLEGDQAYTFCLAERFTQDPGEVSVSAPVTFTTLDAEPSIESEYVTYVESSATTLNAQIDPNAPSTTYYFRYGTSDSYGESTPETALPENGTAIVRIPAAGKPALKPDTTYHYRVVAINALSPAGGTLGSDKTFTTPATLGSGPAQNCSNEQRRGEQPYALELPDCRAYEMVSPLDTIGNDATDPFVEQPPRASLSGGAVTYSSPGAFADPTGSAFEDQYVSRRGPEGWSTQNVTPLHAPTKTETGNPYKGNAFTPELTEGLANSNARLTEEAPPGEQEQGVLGFYVHNFASGTYQYVTQRSFPAHIEDVSTDLSHVAFDGFFTGRWREVSEWVNGRIVPVSVTNSGENMNADLGSMGNSSFYNQHQGWHAMSANGSRLYFTSPSSPETNLNNLFIPQVFARVNAEQPQSPISSPEFDGTGTLTDGSSTVTSLVAAAGYISAQVQEQPGYTKLEVTTSVGKFVVGQTVVGPGIQQETTVTQVGSEGITLSKPITEKIDAGSPISSDGPASFVAGEKISGDGIPNGTTVTAIAPGSLTLSAPAASSGSGVALTEGGGCTVSTDACTIEVSASQRMLANPAGVRTARYWGASADGSRVFFTSDAELTEDAYTGPAGNAPNLYEYDLERPEGERLKDLSVDKTDADGAAVLGVAQISEDGSYVYFVAEGDLGGNAVAGQPNLYVSHDDGTPVFIATLAANDASDWHNSSEEALGGPEENTAVVTPSGNRLAFPSEKSLTGYDNEQAEPGECEGTGKCKEIYLYDAETGGLACASCDPSGARPVGASNFGYGDTEAELYRSRNLSEDGALFFDSSDTLVPHASDGRQNVYEYENGHVYPISDVAGGYESFFMDASANGENVFFGTADQLVPEDTSNDVAVYDARVGGGFPITVSPPPCDNGDACKPPPAPQPGIFGAPGSATFSGPGNIEPAAVVKPAVKAKAKSTKCKKGYVRKKGKCVKRKVSKKKAKKSSDRKGSK
jgi:hypothetical protein